MLVHEVASAYLNQAPYLNDAATTTLDLVAAAEVKLYS